MCLVWDMCTVNITNNTTSPLTFSGDSISTGTFDTVPPANVASGTAGTFAGRSTCGNASDGTQGQVAYSLNDGTLVNIKWYTSYYYGLGDSSSYTVGFQGAHAAQYTAKANSQVTSESNGGAGKRVVWTLSVDLNV